MGLYLNDKKVKITFRCEATLGDWVVERSKKIGLTPSAFVRHMLYQQYYAEEAIVPKLSVNTSTETAVKKCKHQG